MASSGCHIMRIAGSRIPCAVMNVYLDEDVAGTCSCAVFAFSVEAMELEYQHEPS